MSAALVAALLAAAAGALVWPVRLVGRGHRAIPAALVVAAGVGALVLVVPARWWLPAVAVAPAVVGLIGVRRLARRGRHGAAEAERVRLVCEALAGELAAGADAGLALERVAERWPALEGVVTTQRLGGLVPPALGAMAREPGWSDLGAVAAAWQVAERTGAGLSAALDAVGAGLREQGRTRRLVASELASARATARLVAALPVFTLATGSGAGSPIGFLLQTPAGLVCLGAGLALMVAGLAWIEAIAGAVEAGA